jgi:hypothetical protein
MTVTAGSPPQRPAWSDPTLTDAREPLGRDQIVETVRLADAEGLGAVSMRRLGQSSARATAVLAHQNSASSGT